jgi:hypothetical protein
MTFATTYDWLAAFEPVDRANAWKEEEPILVWPCCENCNTQFDGPGSETEAEAIVRARAEGWHQWAPFPAGPDVIDPAFNRSLVCPRCKPDFAL